jgi:hypothetical protein
LGWEEFSLPDTRGICAVVYTVARSRQFQVGIITVSLVSALFVATTTIGSEIQTDVEQNLPNVLGGAAGPGQFIFYTLYAASGTNGSVDVQFCVAQMNESAASQLVQSNLSSSQAVAGAAFPILAVTPYQISVGHENLTVIDSRNLPGMLDSCLIISTQEIDGLNLKLVGTGSIPLQAGGRPQEFVSSVSSSLGRITSSWSLLGYVSVSLTSAVISIFILTSTRPSFERLVEQGLQPSRRILGTLLLCAISSSLALFLTLMFSLFLQSVTVGSANYVLGSSFLYSTVTWDSLQQSAIFSSILFVSESSVLLSFRPSGGAAR